MIRGVGFRPTTETDVIDLNFHHQLKKAISLRGDYMMVWDNGDYGKITTVQAQRAINILDRLKPNIRLVMTEEMASSRSTFENIITHTVWAK